MPSVVQMKLRTLLGDYANTLALKKGELGSASEVVREMYRLLHDGKRAAPPPPGGIDLAPFGVGANRRNLELDIACAYQQGLIPRRLDVDELFSDVTRALDG
jgi:hypothetical protein